MIIVARAVVWALVLLCANFASPARADDGELRVGTYLDNMPWQFRDERGMIVGFEVDLIDAIAARLQRRVALREMVFSDLFTALSDGRIDVAMSSISITPSRRERFDFTQSYYRTSQAMVVMRSSPVRSLNALRGRRVSVIDETTSDQWIRANRDVYGIAGVERVEGLDEGLNLLTAGRVDAHFGDLPALIYRLLGRTDLAVVQRLPTEEQYGLMLAKGSRLTAPVNAAITALKQDGTLARIHQKWFGSQPEAESPVTKVQPAP